MQQYLPGGINRGQYTYALQNPLVIDGTVSYSPTLGMICNGVGFGTLFNWGAAINHPMTLRVILTGPANTGNSMFGISGQFVVYTTTSGHIVAYYQHQGSNVILQSTTTYTSFANTDVGVSASATGVEIFVNGASVGRNNLVFDGMVQWQIGIGCDGDSSEFCQNAWNGSILKFVSYAKVMSAGDSFPTYADGTVFAYYDFTVSDHPDQGRQ
eukprot:Phypoly_transcript_05486.p1 GENE.Phypoly_transcript_05486~~Phypoly_transcript_05486.p1  ORF type:complete len:212 (-),score=35.01 Phypoly_transcript_05486:906-1541(-)